MVLKQNNAEEAATKEPNILNQYKIDFTTNNPMSNIFQIKTNSIEFLRSVRRTKTRCDDMIKDDSGVTEE